MPDQQNVTTGGQQMKEAVATEEASAFDPVDCFKQMILARAINDILKTRKTQGKFDFYIACAGHEAIARVLAALRPDDSLPLYHHDPPLSLPRTRDPYAPTPGRSPRTTPPHAPR